MTHEEHQLRHRELDQAVRELVDDWIAHHLCHTSAETSLPLEREEELVWRVRDRPVRDLLAWSRTQTITAVPLPDHLHHERTSAGHDPCDAECGERFGAGHERCRHLRTAEEWLRTR